MARMNLTLDDKLKDQFVQTAFRVFGEHRGSLGAAATQAFRNWIELQKEANNPED